MTIPSTSEGQNYVISLYFRAPRPGIAEAAEEVVFNSVFIYKRETCSEYVRMLLLYFLFSFLVQLFDLMNNINSLQE